MNISGKQLAFIEYVEKCGYVYRSELNNSVWPESMIEALIDKQLIFECDGMIASTTGYIENSIDRDDDDE